MLAVVLVEGARVSLGAIGVGGKPGLDGTRQLVLLACVGFGMLGLVDDVLASGRNGASAVTCALTHGRVTTGLVKLVGGGALALVLAAAPGPEGRLEPSPMPRSSRSPPISATCSTGRRAAR